MQRVQRWERGHVRYSCVTEQHCTKGSQLVAQIINKKHHPSYTLRLQLLYSSPFQQPPALYHLLSSVLPHAYMNCCGLVLLLDFLRDSWLTVDIALLTKENGVGWGEQHRHWREQRSAHSNCSNSYIYYSLIGTEECSRPVTKWLRGKLY